MHFRIRNPAGDDFAACERTYRQHLSRFKGMSSTDLWKFFRWDFFHDGEIESVQVEGDLRAVTIGLNCPNVRRARPDGTWEYVNVGFKCTFRDVSTFTIQSETPVHDGDVRGNSGVFLDAEINTSELLDRFETENKPDLESPCSLLMRLLAENSIVWIELVFSQVDVVANEPAAFALMEADPRFEVPAYSLEKDERAAC